MAVGTGSFQDTGLDPRLVRALAKRGFTQPTPVQQAAIPKVLEGKDVVARARTGSGKTLAYLLPALHRLLASQGPDAGSAAAVGGSGAAAAGRSFQALVLVPTRELCDQVRAEAAEVLAQCGVDLVATALIAPTGKGALKRAIAGAGHLVVTTPGRLVAAIKEGALQATALQQRLQTLVLDEADLLLSYGYEPDLQLLAPLVPRSCQVLLMSATTSEAVQQLTALILHNPVSLDLLGMGGGGGPQGAPGTADASGASTTITHWAFACPREDKLLVTMAILKLGLVRRKVLIFVNGIDTGYRLRLFLEAFGLRVALLNAEMPLNSRSHCLASFNKGMFDYLIATDDVHAEKSPASTAAAAHGRKRGREGGKKAGKPSKDEEFGVTRGIDFKGVRTIINFDLPSSVAGYVHRVGRTGRAGEEGAALTLLAPEDAAFRTELDAALGGGGDAAAREGDASAGLSTGTARVVASNSDSEDEVLRPGSEAAAPAGLQPFPRLSKDQVEALRYRAEDVARSLTKNTVKEARAKDLRAELLNSDKLKEYFEEHAAERQLLRHDKALHKVPAQAHLRHLPAYLKDPASVAAASETGNRGPAPLDARKRRKLPKPASAALAGVSGPDGTALPRDGGASTQDPLKAVKGFVRAPKRGGHHDEPLTQLEERAVAAGLKEAKKRAKQQGKAFMPAPKRNVRKFKRQR